MAIARTVSVTLQSRLNTYENYTCTTFSGKNDLTDNWLLKSQLSNVKYYPIVGVQTQVFILVYTEHRLAI